MESTQGEFTNVPVTPFPDIAVALYPRPELHNINFPARRIPHRLAKVMPSLLLACAGAVNAQDVPAQESPDPAHEAANVPTLDRVLALPPDEEVLDLHRFQNPIVVPPNTFAEGYRPAPSLEEISLEHGGLINYGINLGLAKSWKGIKKVTRMRPQTQTVTARPPPLDEEQLRRAAELCAAPGSECASEE